MTDQKHNRRVYYLPLFHLFVCVAITLGYLVHALWRLALMGGFLLFFDFPISVVTVALSFKHSLLATIWMYVAGTLWWYLLSCGIEHLFNKYGNRKPASTVLSR